MYPERQIVKIITLQVFVSIGVKVILAFEKKGNSRLFFSSDKRGEIKAQMCHKRQIFSIEAFNYA